MNKINITFLLLINILITNTVLANNNDDKLNSHSDKHDSNIPPIKNKSLNINNTEQQDNNAAIINIEGDIEKFFDKSSFNDFAKQPKKKISKLFVIPN